MQVQQVVLAFDGAGFRQVETFETLQRTWHVTERSVRPDHRMVAHTGFLTIARRRRPQLDRRIGRSATYLAFGITRSRAEAPYVRGRAAPTTGTGDGRVYHGRLREVTGCRRDRSSRAYEKQVHELQTQVKFLEDEIALLRRRLTNAPRQVTILEEKLLETQDDLARAMGQNQKLADALRAESEKIEALRGRGREALAAAGVVRRVPRRRTRTASIDVFTGGRKMRVNADPEIDVGRFRPGVAGHPERRAERGRGPRARTARARS